MLLLKSFPCALACLLTLAISANASAESSVWKVSKDDDYFYLGGTVHMLSPEDHPLPEEFLEAYADAQEVILETDLTGTSSQEFQQKIMSSMMFSDERTLKSELSEDTYDVLASFLSVRGMPIEQFEKFQPWGLSLMMSVQEYYTLGMVPEYGVDSYMEQLATGDEKTLHSLETPDAQLGFLASMGKIDPNMLIQYTIRDLEKLPEFIRVLKEAWRSGDLDMMENNEYVAQMLNEFPEVFDSLLTTRNNNWMKELVTLFDDNAIEVVFVGALHLVGDDGLISQLERAGFDVEQLD